MPLSSFQRQGDAQRCMLSAWGQVEIRFGRRKKPQKAAESPASAATPPMARSSFIQREIEKSCFPGRGLGGVL